MASRRVAGRKARRKARDTYSTGMRSVKIRANRAGRRTFARNRRRR